MKNRDVGILIIGLSFLMGFITYLFNNALRDIVQTACSHGQTCPMWGTIQLQTSISLSIMIFVVLLGIYLILIDYFKKPIPHIHKVKQHRTLLGDEKTIFDHIVKSDGTIFQSKLVEDTGLSKVKITRILDRLEGKEIIDRKRRGMTNIVILKHK